MLSILVKSPADIARSSKDLVGCSGLGVKNRCFCSPSIPGGCDYNWGGQMHRLLRLPLTGPRGNNSLVRPVSGTRACMI